MNKIPAVAAASLPVLVVIAIIERLTSIFSVALAKEVCGKRYMQPYGSVVGDQSCGLDADIYFMALLAMVITVAMMVLLLTMDGKRKDAR